MSCALGTSRFTEESHGRLNARVPRFWLGSLDRGLGAGTGAWGVRIASGSGSRVGVADGRLARECRARPRTAGGFRSGFRSAFSRCMGSRQRIVGGDVSAFPRCMGFWRRIASGQPPVQAHSPPDRGPREGVAWGPPGIGVEWAKYPRPHVAWGSGDESQLASPPLVASSQCMGSPDRAGMGRTPMMCCSRCATPSGPRVDRGGRGVLDGGCGRERWGGWACH